MGDVPDTTSGPAGTFHWYQSTRNHYVARFGEHGSVEVVRPQRHDPRTRRPRPWRVKVFGSHLRGDHAYLDEAKLAAEREVVAEVRRLAAIFGIGSDDDKDGGDDGAPG